MSDWGREARYPYLDEGVVATLAALPLPLLCDLRHEAGRGDKVSVMTLTPTLPLTLTLTL